jgi:hypothetical protein
MVRGISDENSIRSAGGGDPARLVAARSRPGPFDTEIGTDVDALVGKVDFDMSGWGSVNGMKDGRGQIPCPPALGHPPKRVALVSLDAYDPGNTKGIGSPYFGGRTEL